MWCVEYDDGSIVDQVSNGGEVSSESISRENMKCVYLFKDDGSIVTVFDLGGRQNFFYRRRTRMSSDGVSQVCHILGRTVEGNVDVIVFHVEGEGIYSRKDFDSNDPWFYPVNFKECEL